MKYISIGDTDKIGPSAHYLHFDNWGILLDVGLDPNFEGDTGLPDFERIRDMPVNAIIISHAHMDHLAALPVAVRYFPHARIYMTPATAYLSEKMLFHYLQVQRRQAQEEQAKFSPIYTVEEVENLLYLFQSFDYNLPFRIHSFQESEIEIVFWDAGHILGSAGIEIKWSGKKIFYTGNTKKSGQFILKGAKYPPTTDVLITESTYGADERAPDIKKADEVKRFTQFVKERVNFGGAVLIPAFALGRTQEMMVLIHRLIQRHKIPVVPIYLTGFGVQINKIYDRLMHKIYPEYNFQRLRAITYSNLRSKQFRKPSIILATSGMMHPATFSYEFAAKFLNDPKNGIAFVGWADPETPAGALREGKMNRIKSIFGVAEIYCGVDIFHFSAHSNRRELLSMIKNLSPQKTILCHGDLPALHWMQNAILNQDLTREVIIPGMNEEVKLF